MIHPKEITIMRKDYEPKIIKHKGRKRNFHRYITDCSISYGKANKSITPIKGLMSYSYGEEAEKEILSRYEFHSQQRISSKWK